MKTTSAPVSKQTQTTSYHRHNAMCTLDWPSRVFGGAGATEVTKENKIFMRIVGRARSFGSPCSMKTTLAPVSKRIQTTTYPCQTAMCTLTRASRVFGGAGANEVSIKVVLFLKIVGRSWSFDSSFSTKTTSAPVPKRTSYHLHNAM